MKTTFKILLLFLVFVSCQKPQDRNAEVPDAPGHDNYLSGWEADNLKSKVYSVKQSKAYVTDLKTGNTGEPQLEFIKTYNSFGNIISEEHFGTFGDIAQTFEGRYREDGSQCETVWKTLSTGDKTVTTERYDTSTGWISSSYFLMNDSIQSEIIYSFDDKGNFKEMKTHLNGKDEIIHYVYTYNEYDKILSEVQLQESEGKRDTIGTYRYEYDSLGNKIKQFNKSFSEFIKDSKSFLHYDSLNQLMRVDYYECDTIQVSYEYDSFGNEIKRSEFLNGEFKSETNLFYDIDSKGNWTRQKAFRLEIDSNEIPLFVKRREIEYFKK